MEEIWEDIPGYPGYQASTLGRVRTHNKVTTTAIHGNRHWKERVLKFKHEKCSKRRSPQGVGYRVDLWKDGKPHTLLVHRIVASTFLENHLEDNMTVNHKDGNRLNNNIENLEWLTRADNIRYGFEHNQYDSCKKKVELISADGKELVFSSYSDASKFLNKDHSYVSNCLTHKQLVVYSGEEKYEILPF